MELKRKYIEVKNDYEIRFAINEVLDLLPDIDYYYIPKEARNPQGIEGQPQIVQRFLDRLHERIKK